MARARRGAGRFIYPAVFEIRAGEQDQFGNENTAWSVYARRNVDILEKPSGESLIGGVLQGDTRAQLLVRRDPMMARLPSDARVTVKERTWRVINVSEGDTYERADRETLVIDVEEGPPT